MGRNYYCEYCDKRMRDDVQIRRKHIQGLSHQNAMKEHYAKFKDIRTILSEESQKRPCTRFQSDQCKFGVACRFSHYTQAQVHEMQQEVNRQDAAQLLANTSQPIDESVIEEHFRRISQRIGPLPTIAVPSVKERDVPKILAKWGCKDEPYQATLES